MVKRKANLAGRGVEVLFGEGPESPARPRPRSTEPSPLSDAGEPRRGTPVVNTEKALTAEWAAVLERDALAATAGREPANEPGSVSVAEMAVQPVAVGEGQPDRPAAPAETPTEGDLPSLATAVAQPVGSEPAAGEPEYSAGTVSAPVRETEPTAYPYPSVASRLPYESETPPAPAYREGSASVPAPKVKPEAVVDPIVRAQLMGTLYETPTTRATPGQLEPEGPQTPELALESVADYEAGQPSRVRREGEVIGYVGPKQRQALWNEILELYKTVPDILCTDEKLGQALRLLQEAQDILLEKPRQFDMAKYKAGQVHGIIRRRINTSRWANTYGWATFIYEILWLVGLSAAFLFSPVAVNQFAELIEDVPLMDTATLLALWYTMIWGSFGGVLGALYSLYWHAAMKKDFDKQYVMWYAVQPVIGLLIGGLVHLLVRAGFIAAQGETAAGSTVVLQFFSWLVACIAAFRQRFILEIIDRVIQLLTPKSPEERKPAEEVALPQE